MGIRWHVNLAKTEEWRNYEIHVGVSAHAKPTHNNVNERLIM